LQVTPTFPELRGLFRPPLCDEFPFFYLFHEFQEIKTAKENLPRMSARMKNLAGSPLVGSAGWLFF
jgi:hypothetical protein